MKTTTTLGGALQGVRILDMATVLAGPSGATLCGDHGADVVKLELPDGSDALRHMQPVKEGVPLWWKVANRGKRGITLDVRKPQGRELLLSMLPSFDVLVENFRTGTMDRWGLDIETLHRANPRLVVIRLTGFGQTGPYRSRPGFARVFEAMSGFTSLTGEAGGSPLHANFPIGDSVAGLFCAFSIAAEIARLRGDPQAKGAEVDLSATEALFRLLEPLPVEHEQLGQVRQRTGNRTSYTAPSNMYRSADGVWFSLVASSQGVYERLCRAVDRPDWITDPRYTTNPLRVQNMEALDNELAAWFRARTFDDIAQRLEQHELPFTKVYTIADIEADPHFQAREAIIRLPDPEYGSLPAPCIVPRVVGREQPVPRTGPGVGEHNAEVYGEFGLGAQQLDALRAAGVI
ncbi:MULTISPECIES: CaiB/BaiF CoA-transferase family protein [Comamonas]|uniref:CaiB/BaiF CoA transferase family protein n=1 Tax=Comamonas TaxID=283 RepID=UPI0001DA6336|nr:MULTISPECIES: CoA transferase [Comamonas]EFI59357.1 acyl-CoA transferase/carnitine dehydratase [Comamonas thiooxydans]TFF62930.1 CoA transferase [Comamonas sp. A23]